MIQFISVSKIYPNQYQALKNISFEIAEGEFVFFIGPSGSGKTTIIRHLIREELPSEGKIYFADEDITKYKRKHVYDLRRKIGVVFQDYKLIQDKNAFENIAFAMEAAGKSPKDIEETVPYVLDIVGLLDKAYAFPEQLSGGEKQRVAIARAISNNPKLLIADEPTGNLDPDAAWDIVQILTKINNWGTTVIMATHGSSIVDALGKRVITLVNGEIIKDVLKGTYKNTELLIDKEKRKGETKKQNTVNKSEDKKVNEEKIIEKENKKDKEIEKIIVSDEIAAVIKEFEEEEDENEPEKKNKVNEEKDKKKDDEEQKEAKTDRDDNPPMKDAKVEKTQDTKEIDFAKKKQLETPSISLTQRRKAKKVGNDEFEKLVQDSLDTVNKQRKQQGLADTDKKLTPETDLKNTGLSPKPTSILKAFGYKNIKSLQEKGYKEISKIEGLSTSDLKAIKKLINIVKNDP
jgi:cell division transport system ATP-binding protein